MKVHLVKDIMDGKTLLWCGMGGYIHLWEDIKTIDPKMATCKTCLKAHSAWQKRKETK